MARKHYDGLKSLTAGYTATKGADSKPTAPSNKLAYLDLHLLLLQYKYGLSMLIAKIVKLQMAKKVENHCNIFYYLSLKRTHVFGRTAFVPNKKQEVIF